MRINKRRAPTPRQVLILQHARREIVSTIACLLVLALIYTKLVGLW